jgi:hypothetical protein
MNPTDSSAGSWRYREMAWLLIAIAAVVQVARVLGVTAVHGELPSLSANDRSRWAAIAALIEDGKWEIDRVIDLLDIKGKSKIWNTIDLVRHRGRDGREHYYSSKPPLLTAMYAVVCKPVTMLTGKKLTEEPFLIGRIVLLLVNVVPLVLWWIWFDRWLFRNVSDDWSRFILLNTALWGTFLTTFAVTMNNHLHGAIFFAMSLGLLWQIRNSAQQGMSQSWIVWLSCGLCTGLTVACELPALAWAAAAGAILMLVDWKKFLFGYGIGTAVVAAAFLATTVWAHNDWQPPYSHRGLGDLIATLPSDPASNEPAINSVVEQANKAGYTMTDQTKIIPARLTGVLQVIDETVGQRVAVKSSDGGWEIHHWDDWYDYPKSYWLPGNKKGVDLGEANPWMYFLHFMVGHHGIYSVTPIWLLSIVGAWMWIRKPRSASSNLTGIRQFAISDQGLALAFVAVTMACFVFYATRVVEDRNYGGVSSGFRWIFWLVPAWLWLCTPAIESASASKRLRMLVSTLLLASVFSATIPWPNPWTHPWPYRVAIWLYGEKLETKP